MAQAPIGDAEIGVRVRALRKKLDLSGVDLAKAIGVTYSAIKELERGRGTKQYVQLRDLARVLNVTPNVILGVSDMPPDDADRLDMMGAAVQAMLIGEGWSRERAEALVDIATEVALEKSDLDLDRRLAAAFRKRVLNR